MRNGAFVAVIIPALNEEAAISRVLEAVPRWVDDVVVADNGSEDRTRDIVRAHGARVVSEPRRGYGAACLRGMAALGSPDVVVFLDGDYSDHPDEMALLVDPVASGEQDMVIGSRVLGTREQGALTPQARFGNWLACRLMMAFWGARHTDLGPFRAIAYERLLDLDMRDQDYGWTVEMQIKAARAGLRVIETPVSYRKRIGASKISGTVRGVVAAGTKILYTIFAAAFSSSLSPHAFPHPECLVIFTRAPVAGKVKTRLIPALGPAGAARLHRAMTEHTVRSLEPLAGQAGVRLLIRYHTDRDWERDPGDLSGPDPAERMLRSWLGAHLAYACQGPGTLGDKLIRAFADSFREGARRVLIIGTDCPDLDPRVIREGFVLLRRHDVVLGPARDGGYYLVGLRRMYPRLFLAIPWGTDEVLQITRTRAERLGLSVGRLPVLDDVDRPEDLPVWERAHGRITREGDTAWCSPDLPAYTGRCDRPRGGAAEPNRDGDDTNPSITVIIPTVNEERHICAALCRVRNRPGTEVIVVDGGSTDRTRELAETLGARVITTSRGRARQMNWGAQHAQGSMLLFLHADSILPERWPDVLRGALQAPGMVAGAFALQFDERLPWLGLIQRLVAFRSRVMGLPYGDQGLFVHAWAFHAIGGFPALDIMEDFEFVRRIKRLGRVTMSPLPVRSSTRRWKRVGPLRVSVINQLVITGYFLGISPARLARFYRAADPRRG